MNKKVVRLLDSIAVIVCDESPKLINDLAETIRDKRDGYPEYDFIATVNSFRVLLGYYTSISKES